MTDVPASTTGNGKSSLIVGGIALAIVVVLFIVLGTRGGPETGGTAHDESVPHGHDAHGNAVPVITADPPHDESASHHHGQAPQSAPTVVQPGEPHDASVPHAH